MQADLFPCERLTVWPGPCLRRRHPRSDCDAFEDIAGGGNGAGRARAAVGSDRVRWLSSSSSLAESGCGRPGGHRAAWLSEGRLTKLAVVEAGTMSLARTIRLLVGLAFVAGGVSLASPLVTRLIGAVLMDADSGPGEATVVDSCPTAVPREGVVDVMANVMVGEGAVPPPSPALAATVGNGARQAGRRAEVASPSRLALPPWLADCAPASPRLEPAYRSALQSPPPPLLDELESASRSRGRAILTGMPSPAARPGEAVSMTEDSSYRVRDGDDLAGIARRFYGHPHAAAAIWTANQAVIPDPALLPIGVELRLPPRRLVTVGFGASPDAAIEPRSALESP